MILLEQPYVSDYLIETIRNNSFSVLGTDTARQSLPETMLTSEHEAIRRYTNENELFYINSENAINWITTNLPDTKLAAMVELCKNKASFRKKLKSLFPNYFFEECSFDRLSTLDVASLKFPLILKPSVGFLSFGVYPVHNADEWESTIHTLNIEMNKIKGIFPSNVVDSNNFIIEELIEGEEFAIDAYFDSCGKATILNIFKHPFFNNKDVSDRAYFTSKEIVETHLEPFQRTLDEIGETVDFQNFPCHIELRVNKNAIIPIEINPLRFCGWCITDIAQHAWGINVYEYFLKQLKPDWNRILSQSDNQLYYFTIADVPSDINKKEIKEIDYKSYVSNIQNPLEIRKIDYRTKPVFAIVFAKTPSTLEIQSFLQLDMHKFIRL